MTIFWHEIKTLENFHNLKFPDLQYSVTQYPNAIPVINSTLLLSTQTMHKLTESTITKKTIIKSSIKNTFQK